MEQIVEKVEKKLGALDQTIDKVSKVGEKTAEDFKKLEGEFKNERGERDS